MLYDIHSLLQSGQAVEPYALVLLNQPINESVLRCLAKHASAIVCADGGANRLHHLEQNRINQEFSTRQEQADMDKRLPDAIVGDLDSLSQCVESHYRSHDVPIIHDPDQYSTDFTKSLKYIRNLDRFQVPHKQRCDVIVFGGIGGRVDQGLSQLHHLFMAMSDPTLLNGQIFLVSESSLSFPLPEGKHQICCSDSNSKWKQQFFTENVGVIPMLGPATISLTGFEWDVKNWQTMIGGMVSTSNHVNADVVEVECDRRVLFTIEFVEKFKLEGTG